jgi:hypothetical protein
MIGAVAGPYTPGLVIAPPVLCGYRLRCYVKREGKRFKQHKTVVILLICACSQSPGKPRGGRLIVYHDLLTNTGCTIITRSYNNFLYFAHMPFCVVESIKRGYALCCHLRPFLFFPSTPTFNFLADDSLDMINLDYSVSRINTPIWLSLMNLVSAQAKPMSEALRSLDPRSLDPRSLDPRNLDPRSLNPRNENIYISTGDSPTDRTIFILLSIFCTIVLSFLLGEGPCTVDRARH